MSETTPPTGSILEHIDDIVIGGSVSQKSGKPYRFLEVRFSNGYPKRIFLEQAEMFMVDSLLKKT